MISYYIPLIFRVSFRFVPVPVAAAVAVDFGVEVGGGVEVGVGVGVGVGIQSGGTAPWRFKSRPAGCVGGRGEAKEERRCFKPHPSQGWVDWLTGWLESSLSSHQHRHFKP